MHALDTHRAYLRLGKADRWQQHQGQIRWINGDVMAAEEGFHPAAFFGQGDGERRDPGAPGAITQHRCQKQLHLCRCIGSGAGDDQRKACCCIELGAQQHLLS